MAHDEDGRPRYRGIRVEMPFFSFSFGPDGWGWQMGLQADDEYERARRRVRARLGFYRHLATYFSIIAAIVFIDLITGGGLSNVVLWFAGIWGALLVWQAFNVFIFPSVWSPEAEERMIEEELRRRRDA